ncbi:ABC transporter permease [Candidatus Spongiihabitans sp.]|uniref:ABC transporter permease n=1 Tax=Candidatus Spongiihabitans sp. TaxID=3101308 RepID=UPI003C6F357C
MLKDLIRHTRLAEFNLLFLGLLLVGMALAAVGLFTDRVEQGMQTRTSALLGADGMIDSTRPVDDSYATLAGEFGLQVARSVSFMSMAITATGSRLAGVRAVSSHYPLRGELLLAAVDGNNVPESVSAAPPRGTVWSATQLVKDLNLELSPELQLGDSFLRFEREILLEPESGAGMLRLAPRLLMNIDDLDQTGLVTAASRARFRLLVAGSKESLAAFGQAIEPILKPYQSWHVADLRRDEVRNTIGRVVSYLRVTVLLSVVLAIVAMALAAQGLWGRQIHEIALLRCLGQHHSQTLKSLARVYMLAVMPVSLLGIGLGYLVQHFAAAIIQDATGIPLPPPTWLPIWLSLLMCVVVVAAVMIPILLAVKRVPTMTLLRAEQIDGIRRNRSASLSILALVIIVTVFLARNLWLAFGVLSGLVFAAAILWFAVRSMIGAAKRLIAPRSTAWYAALKALQSNSGRSAWLASAFGAAIFALVLLGAVREDLFEEWQNSLPPDAPNLFLLNIQAHETEAFSSLLNTQGVTDVKLYPIMRARITAINNRKISDRTFEDEDARHRINHDFNLTVLAELPVDNRLSAGNWFKDGAPDTGIFLRNRHEPKLNLDSSRTNYSAPYIKNIMKEGEKGFSVEQDTAKLLGLALGDRLTMDIAGVLIEAPVSSLREVKWDNMRPNFYIIAAPGLLDDAPRNYITSIYVEQQRNELVRQISQSFPHITAIDLGMLLGRIRTLANQGGNAVNVVFVFTLVTALLVLFGVLQGQRSARELEIALLKTLGAGREFVRRAIVLEFAFLGALAGFIGGGMALLSGWLLAKYVFEFAYSMPWQWLAFSIAGAVIVVATIGYISVRSLLGVRPVRLLARMDWNSKPPVSN